MTKNKKMLLIGAGALLLLALVVYGVSSLSSKMNEAKRLNEQIAQASGEDDKEPDQGDGEQPEASGQPGDASGEAGGDEAGAANGSATEGSNDDGGSTEGQNGQGGAAAPGQASSDPNGSTSPEPSPAASGGQDSGGANPTVKPSTEPGTPSSGGSDNPSATTSPDDKSKVKQGIDAAITKEMEQLRASCTATSSSLVKKIAAELKADPDAGLDKIQGAFLDDVIAAEAKCDSDFNALLSKAKEQYKSEGISETTLPDWSSEYASSKEKARANALSAIANAM
ncbi:hypothetical protein ACX93W_18510 [Paenibacillus sp. CAU 1782]